MTDKKKEVDFTKGNIYKNLVIFSIPLLLGNLLQQMYFIADSMVVGNLIGDDALAAVGAASSITIMFVFFFQGIASGAGILISQLIGAHEPHKMKKVIKAATLFTVIAGIVTSVIGYICTADILNMISVPKEVFRQTYLYLAVSFGGMLPMLIYNMGAAILQAMGDSKTPLYYLAIASVINIVLDILFVNNMGMGVEGTALATVVAQLVSAALIFVTIKKKGKEEERKYNNKDDSKMMILMKKIMILGVPIGVQQIVINLSGVIVQNHINSIGKEAMAAWTIFSRIDTFVILPFLSFGVAAMTYVGQNYGAGQIKRIFQGVKASMIMSIVVTVAIGAVICAVPEYLFMLFSKQAVVINLACDMMWHMVPFYALLAIAKIYSSAVSGTGNSMVPMIVNIMFMCVSRMIMIPVFTSNMGYTMDVLYYTYYISWVLTAVVIGGYYHIYTKKQLKQMPGMV